MPRDPVADAAPRGCVGKGIVYARRPIVTPDTEAWLTRGVRDVPRPGQHIAAGHPVCTVLARGRDREECLAGLFSAAATVYADSEGPKEGRRERTTHLDHRSYA
jgi:predicted ATP-grasp superfamily ATP-dependent carboligase